MAPRRVWGFLFALGVVLVATAFTLQVNAAPPTDPLSPAWTIVSSPNVSGRNNQLHSISVVSANDVWAVGNSAVSPTPATAWTLTQHWDGTSWSEVSSPSPGQWHILNGVAAQATNDVWAVGDYNTGPSSSTQSLILHWTGSAWTQVAAPNSGSYTYLYGVAVRASNDAWAVGTTGGLPSSQTVIEHWNGTSWDLVSSPNYGSGRNELYGVAVLASNDAWAVRLLYRGESLLRAARTLGWQRMEHRPRS